MDEPIQNYGFIESFNLGELIAFPIYLILAYFFAYTFKLKKQHLPHYRYFVTGLTIKIIGAFAFCFVYIYVYKGGDTIAYYESARSFSNLFLEDFTDYFRVVFSPASEANYQLFSGDTGYPWSYMYFEEKTNFLIKLSSPIVFVCFNSYLLSCVAFSILSYIGIWKAYTVFIYYYPDYYKPLFWLFVVTPTSVFWASGILKDTIILAAVGVFLYCCFTLFELKHYRFRYFFWLAASGILILSIKAYVLLALIPGIVFWLFGKRMVNKKLFVALFMMGFIFGCVYFMYSFFGYASIQSSFEDLLKEASIKQRDLKQSYYSGSSFDIGDYEPTIGGAVGVSHKALFAGLFRPTIFDARNIQMVLAALENLFLLILVIVVFIFRIKTVAVMLRNNPFLILCLSFSILMALLIGLSTSNFGALVRFKTVFESYFFAALYLFYKRATMHLPA